MIGADAAFPKHRSELGRIGGNPRSNITFPPKTAIPGYTGFVDSMNSLLVSSKPNARIPLDWSQPAQDIQDASVTNFKAQIKKPIYATDYVADRSSYMNGSGPHALGKTVKITSGFPVAVPIERAGGDTSTLAGSLSFSDTGGPVSGGGGGAAGGASGESRTTANGTLALQGGALRSGGGSERTGESFLGYSGVESTYRNHYPMRAQTAPAWATRPPRQDIMFQTTYGNHFGTDSDVARAYRDDADPLGFRPLTATFPGMGSGTLSGGVSAATAAAAAARRSQPLSQTAADGPTAPRMKQYLDDKSTYREDFSLRPLDRNAPIRAGTIKQTNQVLSYRGFIPASKTNDLAVRQAFEPSAGRTEQKEGIRLLTLDQYSRLRPVSYAGYRPQSSVNAHVFDPPHANMNTSTGRAEYFGTVFKSQPAKSAGPNAGLPKQTMLSFFTPGKTAVSDNGITNAQSYYIGNRPNEGLPSLYRAPGTTYYGKQYTPQGVTTFK